MTPDLLVALLNFATRFGLDAAIAFFESRNATIEDAVAALKLARDKSLDQYIAEDKAARTPQT